MDKYLHDCLYPVMLGANAQCHACARRLQKRYGVTGTVICKKRTLTLRILPADTIVEAPPTLSDELLLTILRDAALAGGARIPLLVLCDAAYAPFVGRNRAALETQFILRRAEELSGEEF